MIPFIAFIAWLVGMVCGWAIFGRPLFPASGMPHIERDAPDDADEIETELRFMCERMFSVGVLRGAGGMTDVDLTDMEVLIEYGKGLALGRDPAQHTFNGKPLTELRAALDTPASGVHRIERDAALEREMRDAQSLASLLRKERERLEFLHSNNKDADGWEWGVARVRVGAGGRVEYLWGVSDHSDIDAAMAAQQGEKGGA